ncbi:MAG: hypothetical protein HQM09_00060 [Candidatus Riflebacteria bacterium]|nr:hypothetical protein [Candidatus Riflebacteria bacterium]
MKKNSDKKKDSRKVATTEAPRRKAASITPISGTKVKAGKKAIGNAKKSKTTSSVISGKLPKAAKKVATTTKPKAVKKPVVAAKTSKSVKPAKLSKTPVALKPNKIAVKAKARKTVKVAGKSSVKSAVLLKTVKAVVKPAGKKKISEKNQALATPVRLEKPWPVSRIHSFMRIWGMTQVEMAVFCGVSYDSVTSWSRGRRRLVRRSIADHLEAAEESAREREFPRGSAGGRSNPWLALRKFCRKTMKLGSFKALPKETLGTFPLLAVETFPRVVRRADRQECLRIRKVKGKEAYVVELIIGKKTLELDAIKTHMGDSEVIALTTSEKDAPFFNGRAGCITIAQHLIRVSLWPTKSLPIRMIASS